MKGGENRPLHVRRRIVDARDYDGVGGGDRVESARHVHGERLRGDARSLPANSDLVGEVPAGDLRAPEHLASYAEIKRNDAL